jgi:site-specific recombinase XerD
VNIQILAQQFYDYSIHIKGYSKNTIKGYRQAINLYCRIAGIENVSEISRENIQAYFFNGRIERKWKSGTLITFHLTLGVFFRWCQKNGYLQSNPLADIEIHKPEKRLPPKLTKEESFKLLEIVSNYPYSHEFLRHRNHAIFATFLFAGLRKHELLNLKLTDVDIGNLSIFVNQGKGSKDRIVPISFALAQVLDRYLSVRKTMNKTCPHFFVSLRLNTGFSETGLKHFVNKIRTVSGFKFSIHKLRHTFATLMLEGGCDIYSLSRMMGHSDIKTTTIYLYASAEHLRGQIQKHPLNTM